MHIVDGQGRAFGLHSFKRSVELQVLRLEKAISKIERSYHSGRIEDKTVALRDLNYQHGMVKSRLERVNKFLCENSLAFVCYAAGIREDNRIFGLDMQAERRLYIEGNALNAQASKEEVLKYEAFSPIVVDLEDYRLQHEWLTDEYIEDESKSIGSNSVKLFTLSSLVQSYTLSIINQPNPIKIDDAVFEWVDERRAFVHAYWDRITELFGDIWVPYLEAPRDRLRYLKTRRAQQHVAFQATFLIALGRLGFAAGVAAKRDPASPVLHRLAKLSPEQVHYLAQEPSDPTGYHAEWRSRMMKPAKNPDTGEYNRYTFNNSSENIRATFEYLAGIAGIPVPTSGSHTEAPKLLDTH